ncbi:MAM and LDL-receptor class A domain-containing protein 2 isoform X2 [Gouania willdenowi]|uniref:MAM and LDL-receptor class A domain-containing protein 2 isoform X2 n=1 Tax=Gouania willdenowi TaxID=441366 RepID=UPI0010544851|nr:MAM and LDL-receptor class A domain-containing protein 1 isoform X2 [Gouania willdenowi]
MLSMSLNPNCSCCSCDFEHHSCGWKNNSATSYSWRWEMANVTSVPGQDHTNNSLWGHVMHVDGKQEGGLFAKATLEYLVKHRPAVGCQINFWYYILSEKPISSSSSFQLTMIKGSSEKKLLLIHTSQTDSWQKATAFLGNQPGGYKLRISFSPSLMETVDAFLDDVIFENCADGDVPAGSDRLSCDFETDTCSWYHDYRTDLLWRRTTKELNDMGKNNHYMLIKAAPDVKPTSVARLVSFPQPAGQALCVSFIYHIFGNSIGSLRFITKQSGQPETVVWMRSGTQGNKWRFADLTFNSDQPIQFIIEAVVGGDQGSIAIDNLVVTFSENSSCPAERECTFQGSTCGLLSKNSTDFNWERITGAFQPSNSSGPLYDHTLGTEQGYYLSAQLWHHPVGAKGAIMTTVMEPTPSSGECLMFWYYMEGRDVGELSVYLQTFGSGQEIPIQLWKRVGDQGTHWRHGRVSLFSPDTQYQVIFEATAGKGPRRDVAIDDLTVLNDVCPPTGFCDFELDFCSWVNNAPQGSGVNWDWLSGSSSGHLVPRRDHTTDSVLGHFAIFMTSRHDKEIIAQLESESMEAVDQACLEIWHYADMWIFNVPSDVTLTVFLNESSALHPLWNTSGFVNNTWIRDRVDYSASSSHKIILQAKSPAYKTASFSIDDVHIIRNQTCDDLTPTTTPSPPTTTTAPASSLDCSFEGGLCNWIQEDREDLNWTLSRGDHMQPPWDGPHYDHTTGNNQGKFLLLNGSGSKGRERASISASVITTASQLCVGFWYYMLGPSVSNLDLLVVKNSSEWPVWTRRGTQNPEWRNIQVTISTNNVTQLKFAGYRESDNKGFIALDDITVRDEACSDQNVCGFDSDMCGFEYGVSHVGRWVRRRGTKDQVDHTYGTDNGFYMTVKAPQSSQPEVAQLLTPKLSYSREICVRFWYLLPESHSNTFSIHVLQNGELGEALWLRHGAPSKGWEVAEVTVSSPLNFNVVFQAVHLPGTGSTLKMDDYSVRKEACRPPASCDFESGQCTWVNAPREDGHDWALARGGFPGPSTDHTTATVDGLFLLSSALHNDHSSVAVVASEWIHVTPNISCLTLWCHMNNSDSGTLRVLRRLGPSGDDLIFHSDGTGNSWSRLSESIETSEPFQLLIEAESNSRGFIAIDDITLTAGRCQDNETSAEFVGCSFEIGTCEWEDVSVGQVKWERGRNATGNNGPVVDNTLGTDLGWYMAVTANQGDQISPATLESPTMTQASATCRLHFYYSMQGEGLGGFNVVLKGGSTRTTLWHQSGHSEVVWRHSEVAIGRIPREFSILFEASRTLNQLGHISLDDVDFINCSLPEAQPSCPESMFVCNNRVCVDQSSVCDFTDDCGDGSDENNCELHGVVERCSFEQGLCSWTGANVDTLWKLHRGEEVYPTHGPPRDHTQNSAAGSFAVPGTHLIEGGQTSEMISRTFLPSMHCNVRFYFFSLNDASAALTVHLRTLRSGHNDVVLWSRDESQSYNWRRAEVTFSSSANSKIVFSYEVGKDPRGLVAVDGVSFSRECRSDPTNSHLPETSPTSAPATSLLPTSTAPVNPCQNEEFFCWRSEGKVCISSALKCDYRPDCPQAEDEADCGSCTFENGQCQWAASSDGLSTWHRVRCSNDTEPSTDHTTGTGYYMTVDMSEGSVRSDAKLHSPPLNPSSPYCQFMFHFHISAESAGSLRVLMQQSEGSEAILWSRSYNTISHWTPEHLPVGLQRHFKVWFSYISKAGRVAVDDVSFLNCHKSYQPPALSAYGSSFEDGFGFWVQGAHDELDWLSRSGPTDSPNTGPAGDHTSGKGKYLYIESSPPSQRGNTATLKSLLLPPAGENGYCITFWYHMFGATVGSLKMFLQTADPWQKILVWQKSGNQEDEWYPVHSHVTLQKVHQVILEASVGGEAGDIAIDDISFIHGPCPASDVCDFEEGSCNWQQETNDDSDWLRNSGVTSNPNTGPAGDHTTSTQTGHYYLLPSSPADWVGQRAAMFSPLYPAARGTCVQLWYNMFGRGVGTLNVYQQSEEGSRVLLFSQTGDQGRLWRFGQAALLPRLQPYRIVVEGVKAGPTQEGDLAFDDVQLTDAQCPPHGFCDFETGLCSWSNVGGGIEQGDWLLGRGDSTNPNTGPGVDHTTNSTHGHYIYVDNSVGEWGDMSFLVGDVFQPSLRGHCLTFWYHMKGDHVGTLKVYINDREMHAAGSEDGALKWIETGNKGDKWETASVSVKHDQAFWFVFVYQRGMNTEGDVALDDITIVDHGCNWEPPITAPNENDPVSISIAVFLSLLAAVIMLVFLYMLNRSWKAWNLPTILNEEMDQSSSLNIVDKVSEGGSGSNFSFLNKLYDPSPQTTDDVVTSTDA